jgi:hypothetical protein
MPEQAPCTHQVRPDEPPASDSGDSRRSWPFALLCAGTGITGTLWLTAQFRLDSALRESVWLLAIATLIAWAAYLSRRSHIMLRHRLDQLEHSLGRARCSEGYATGYVDGIARAAPDQRAPLHAVN